MHDIEPSGWIAIAGLAIAMLAQALVGAWHMGRLYERQAAHADRLKTLEGQETARGRDDAAVGRSLAGIASTLTAMGREIGEIKAELHGRK